MKRSIRRSVIGVFSATAVAAAAFTLASPASANSAPESAALSAQEQALLNSDDHKIVTLDPATGDVVSVGACIPDAGSRTAHTNGCTTGRTYWGG